MRVELRPGPEPLQVDAVPVIAVATVGWLVAFVVLLAVGERGLWLWTCLAGAGLGLVGLPLARAQYRSAARRSATAPGSGTVSEAGAASGSSTGSRSGPASESGTPLGSDPAPGSGPASDSGTASGSGTA